MSSEQIYQQIRQEKIIIIIRGVGLDKILDIAKAVQKGGCKFLEVTCNTDGFSEMIKLLSKEMSDMVIGAGTVTTKKLADEAIAAGAKYLIAPDCYPDLIKWCVERDIAIIPGAATATDVLTAVRSGAKMIKIFPASCIGAEYIKQLCGPIDDIDFLAVGGVRIENIKDFLTAGCIGIGIGGSLVKKEFVDNGDWNRISREVAKYVKEIRKS
ncbi:MAG: bifunctional 4-hydroxy-2-oxoglutarate aldolase/2-dehydro-3-deoxy-phosphogluconate aldolase [Sedimentisphaerales bacterium]|nr:bifunctional 4-hydroxy-2-oxoglutarate aldolase/2-dehydro-3-deoxy-phosphogluconate aldolase [Sedimentisphaerales bacterium]